MTEGWFHTQSLTNNGIYGKARQRDDASIVPYKWFASFVAISKVSPRQDEGIPPYRYFLMFRHQPYPISYSSFLVPN